MRSVGSKAVSISGDRNKAQRLNVRIPRQSLIYGCVRQGCVGACLPAPQIRYSPRSKTRSVDRLPTRATGHLGAFLTAELHQFRTGVANLPCSEAWPGRRRARSDSPSTLNESSRFGFLPHCWPFGEQSISLETNSQKKR